MDLTRHNTTTGPRWAVDGEFLPAGVTLSGLLALPAAGLSGLIGQLQTDEAASGDLLAPIDTAQEVWGSGVTYLRSRDARKAESKTSADVYQQVYDADRPEIFFKQVGWRTVGQNWCWLSTRRAKSSATPSATICPAGTSKAKIPSTCPKPRLTTAPAPSAPPFVCSARRS